MQMAKARHLFERVLDGIESSLSARLVLVGGAAADTDPTDMHLALGHDRQSASESNDSGNQRKSWYHAPFEILTIGQFLNAASEGDDPILRQILANSVEQLEEAL